MNVLGAKRLELVSEVIPKDVLLALLINPNNPNAGPDTKDLQNAAEALGLLDALVEAIPVAHGSVRGTG